jgi:hypothetical protein
MKITLFNFQSGFILLLALLVSPSLYSQHKPRFFNQTDFTKAFGVGNIYYESIQFKGRNTGQSFRMRTQFGVRVENKYALGIGYSMEYYPKVDANVAPVFIEYKRFFSEEFGQVFGYGTLGYSLQVALDVQTGPMGEFGLGTILRVRKVKLTPSIGLNIQQLTNHTYLAFNHDTGMFLVSRDDIVLKSLKLNIGITF